MKTTTNPIARMATTILTFLCLAALTLPAMAQHTSTFNLETGTGTGQAADYIWNDTILTINDGANIEITGTVANGRRIEVAADAVVSITLNEVSITGPDTNQSPLLLNSGANVNLMIVGENTLTAAGVYAAGIGVPESTRLTIDGTGSLTATAFLGGAGIGGLYPISADAGIITVNGGIVTAIGCSFSAGIGGMATGSGGTITINGGEITATGSGSGAGIGGGGNGSGGNITINGGVITAIGGSLDQWNGGAGIGGGNIGASGTITINGGVVTATGGHYSAGIGGGSNGSGGDITISDGLVTATGGSWGAGIGGGSEGSGGNVTISGGLVTTTGGGWGAGIGGGAMGSGGNVTINGGVVTATGGNSGAGIGYGWSSNTEEGTFTMTGNAIVFTNSVSDTDISRRTGGILVMNNVTHWYGDDELLLSQDVTIPRGWSEANFVLTIGEGKTLTVPSGITLTNNGVVVLCGNINRGSGNGYGTWEGNEPIVVGTVIDLSDDNPVGGCGWRFANGIYTILDGVDVTVRGDNAGNDRRIEVAANAKNVNITLEDVTTSSLSLNSGAEVEITLVGTNTLTAGIWAPLGTTLTIDGTGSLTATGGGYGAGIGGGSQYGNPCGNIIINGGVITASSSSGGAGIGGSSGGAGGTITINGGVITAIGGSNDAGIGGGYNGAGGTISINGNAIVFTNSVSDTVVSRRTGGILVINNVTHWYGNDELSLSQTATFPEGSVLTVGMGKTLTVPSGITLTNNGAVVVCGGSINHGVGYGTWANNNPITGGTEIDLSNANPVGGCGWAFANDVYTILSGADVVVRGNNSGSVRRIVVAADAKDVKITMDNVTIGGPGSNPSPLLLNSGAEVALTLVGISTVAAGWNSAGILAPAGTTLTIDGIGSLTATGDGNGAGIGGSGSVAGGNITISGGVVTANGYGSAGIGGGSSGAAGTFTLNGDAVVFANSISDTDVSRKTSGILFIGNTGTFYGTNVTVSTDVTIPENRSLTVPTNATLTINTGTTLTNNGTVIRHGTINYGSSYGTWLGNLPFVPVTDIIDVPTTAILGTPLPLTGTVVPADATNKTIVWSVQSAGTTATGASITSSALSTTGTGTVTVRATITNGTEPSINYTSGISYTQDFTLTVQPVAVTNIINIPSNIISGSLLTGTIAPSNATYQTIVWSVKDAGTTGATITNNIISVTSAGSVTVTATIANGVALGINYTQDFTITVQPIAVTGITGVPITVVAGTPLTLTGTVTPATATYKTIVWGIQNAGTTDATLIGNTLFTTTAGTVLITATITDGVAIGENYVQGFSITVNAPFVAVTNITDVPTTTVAGTPLPLTGTVVPTDATNQTIAWSIQSGGGIATISGNTLNTTSAGTVTVRATVTNGTTPSTNYTQDFNVTVQPVAVTNITNVPSSIVSGTLLTGGTIAPSNATYQTIVWSVKDAGTTGATITNNVISVTSAGSVTVTATITNGVALGINYTQDFTITVQPIAVTGITGVPTTVVAGTPLTLTGTVAPANATNKTIAWSIANAGTTGATIIGNTLFTTTAGTVLVMATVINGVAIGNNYEQGFSITVNPPFVPVTNIIGVPTTVVAGTPLPLTGTVVPTNATNQTIAWSIVNAGATGANIIGNTLFTTAAGSVLVMATITDGVAIGQNYEDGFLIEISAIVNAQIPIITAHPQGNTYTQNAVATTLSVTANVTDGGTLSYQWYSNTANSNSGGTPVGTGNTYTPPTATIGTMHYYVVITNTIADNGDGGTKTVTATSNVAVVTVGEAGTSIAEVETDEALRIYPNPVTNGVFYVETGHAPSLQSNRIEIYNFAGTLVHAQHDIGSKTEINISHLPDGTYIVKTGNATTKIIKR